MNFKELVGLGSHLVVIGVLLFFSYNLLSAVSVFVVPGNPITNTSIDNQKIGDTNLTYFAWYNYGMLLCLLVSGALAVAAGNAPGKPGFGQAIIVFLMYWKETGLFMAFALVGYIVVFA